MVVKLFYNPYQALKRNIIIRTLIKDKHITLPILMLYNFQNKKKTNQHYRLKLYQRGIAYYVWSVI